MRYHFGRCQLDTESREIALDGASTRVPPKRLHCFGCSSKTGPRVIHKAEVRAAIGDTGAGHSVSQTVSLTTGDVVIFGAVETRLDVQPFDDSAASPLSVRARSGLYCSFAISKCMPSGRVWKWPPQ